MAIFNPDTDFKYNPGSFSSGSFGGQGIGNFSSAFGSSGPTFNPSSFSGFNYKGIGSLPGIPDYSSVFAPKQQDQQTKKSPFTDFARFAGQALDAYAQNRNKQNDSSPLTVGGGGGVTQSGDLTIVYPLPKQVIPAQGGGIGGALGTIAGIGASFIPGLGPGIAAALPGIGGTIGGAFG
jgi:hypothetical protein